MNPKIAGFSTALLLSIGLIVRVGSRTSVDVPPVTVPPSMPTELVPQKSPAELRAERDAFFEADVEPSITEADELNREAAERCEQKPSIPALVFVLQECWAAMAPS